MTLSDKQNIITKPIVVTPVRKLELPDFKEVWEHQDLLWFLVQRELKTRFQQTYIGVLWIALQPIIQTLIFYVILGVFVKVPTGDIPYPLFFLSGFIVWQLFSQIVNSSAYSLLGNIGIITKAYFPRLVMPLASTICSLVDFFVSLVLVLALMAMSGYPLTVRFIWLPLLVFLTMLFSSGVGLLFGALMVSFRDMKNLLGFIMLIWFYLTPLIYPVSTVPEEVRIWFHLNPMTSLVDAFRWVFLGTGELPSINSILVSTFAAMAIWFLGAIFFKRMENTVADVM